MDPVTNAFTAQAELILNSPVEVGGTVLADAGKLIGIYAMSDKLWLDLSGIELFGAALPGAAADFAASELVAALYSAVDTYLTVDADGLFGGGDTAAALALMNADGSAERGFSAFGGGRRRYSRFRRFAGAAYASGGRRHAERVRSGTLPARGA